MWPPVAIWDQVWWMWPQHIPSRPLHSDQCDHWPEITRRDIITIKANILTMSQPQGHWMGFPSHLVTRRSTKYFFRRSCHSWSSSLYSWPSYMCICQRPRARQLKPYPTQCLHPEHGLASTTETLVPVEQHDAKNACIIIHNLKKLFSVTEPLTKSNIRTSESVEAWGIDWGDKYQYVRKLAVGSGSAIDWSGTYTWDWD